MNSLHLIPVLLFLSLIVPALHALAANPDVIYVDGTTGEILGTTRGSMVFYPDEAVALRIVKADLLHFRYSIDVTQSALDRTYYVTGVPGSVLVDRTPNALTTDVTLPAACTLSECRDPCPDLRAELSEQNEHIAAINNGILVINNDVGQYIDFKTEHFRSSWKKEPIVDQLALVKDAIEDVSSIASRLQLHLDKAACAGKECDCQTVSIRLLTSLRDQATASLGVLAKQRVLLEQWVQIMNANEPTVERLIRIEDVAKRYTVTVNRAPLTSITSSLAALPPAGPSSRPQILLVSESDASEEESKAKPVPTSFASVTFEGHTLSRLIISMGFSGFRSHSTYSFVPSVARAMVYHPIFRADTVLVRVDSALVDSVTHRIHESEARPTIEPFILFGMYFGGVDNQTDENGGFGSEWYNRFFVFIGTNLALSPQRFYIGANYDFPAGVTLGGGAVIGKKDVLVPPWTIESPAITEEAKGKIGTPPTETRTSVDFFFDVSFRPVFLITLYELIKKAI